MRFETERTSNHPCTAHTEVSRSTLNIYLYRVITGFRPNYCAVLSILRRINDEQLGGGGVQRFAILLYSTKILWISFYNKFGYSELPLTTSSVTNCLHFLSLVVSKTQCIKKVANMNKYEWNSLNEFAAYLLKTK